MGPTSFAKLFVLISFLILTSSVYVQAAVITALEDTGIDSDPAPTNDITQQLTVKLPICTRSADGTGKDSCLAFFTTTSDFGNWVLVSQATEAADLAHSHLKVGEATHVRGRPAEDDEKRKGTGDKAQGISTVDKHQWGTYIRGKRIDKRQSDGTLGTVGRAVNNQGDKGEGNSKRADETDDCVVSQYNSFDCFVEE